MAPETEVTGGTLSDFGTDSDIPEIVGSSVAGVVLVGLIMAVTIYFWKKGKCERSTTVVENNEMYGAAQTYDEYDKDAYDTKVVDNNDY